jgi:hypothetical protein
MAQPPAIRASDAERERVVTRLREAAGDGRLDPDEFDERLGAAFQARTQEELAPLIADLPRRARMPRVNHRVGAYVLGSAALVSLWVADVGARNPLIVGDSDFFWPIVPIVAWGAAIVLKRRPRRPRLTA